MSTPLVRSAPPYSHVFLSTENPVLSNVCEANHDYNNISDVVFTMTSLAQVYLKLEECTKYEYIYNRLVGEYCYLPQ